MKKHIKIYCDFFGYGEQDYKPSEISGLPLEDVHHISQKGLGGSKKLDTIRNLIGLTREEHDRAHRKKKPYLSKKKLQEIHDSSIFDRLLLVTNDLILDHRTLKMKKIDKQDYLLKKLPKEDREYFENLLAAYYF